MTTETPTPCRYFDRQGIVQQERGLTADAAGEAHLASCAECQRRRSHTDNLRDQLRAIPAVASGTHWEQGVWDRIAVGTGHKTSSQRRWWIGFPVLVVAAAVLLLVRIRPLAPVDEPAPPTLALAFEAGADRLRNAEGAVAGGTTVVTVSGLTQPHAELRIYRQDAGLVLHCSNQRPCVRDGGRLVARFTNPAIGRYRVVLVEAAAPLPPVSGDYDKDTAAVINTGGRAHLEKLFEVW